MENEIKKIKKDLKQEGRLNHQVSSKVIEDCAKRATLLIQDVLEHANENTPKGKEISLEQFDEAWHIFSKSTAR